jgi:magnesium chelatase family protein
LPNIAVKESRERIKSAVRNCGFDFPWQQAVDRYRGEKKLYANAQMPPKLIRKHCAISAEGEKLLEAAIAPLGLSARAHDRILKVSRTIADLESAASIEPKLLSEAIQYRTLDRTHWT